ncbi:MAG: hypothetical protein RB191_19470 [Terriglobia bacterium]|nr:hypothetical protein [Terriglobia bacterium]
MSVEVLKAIFDWLAVVLVGLTFIAGAGALITGNILSDRQTARLKEFDKSLTQAKTDLATQQERAAKAEGQIASAYAASKEAVAKVAIAEARVAEASAKAESFRLDIAKANKSAAEAQAQVASASAEAARANLELAKLKTPRNLTPEQQEHIGAAISQFANTPYDLWVSTDSDSTALMGQIDAALQVGKWEFHTSGDIQFANKAGIIAASGVQIHIAQESVVKLGPPAIALADALRAEGIDIKTVYSDGPGTNTNMDKNRVHVFIGSKPLN